MKCTRCGTNIDITKNSNEPYIKYVEWASVGFEPSLTEFVFCTDCYEKFIEFMEDLGRYDKEDMNE